MTSYIRLSRWIGLGLYASLFSACAHHSTHTEGDLTSDIEAEKVAEVCAPISELNHLDRRIPVPLKPNMAWHQKQSMMKNLVAIQLIVDGVSKEDWKAVESASYLIATSPDRHDTCSQMGAGADGFTAMALDFHSRADDIVIAAKNHDANAVLKATSHTLQACTSCHSTYRQDVLDEEEWGERVGAYQGHSGHDQGH